MVEPVVVWNNYADAIFGYNSSTPVTVSIPDDLWDSWTDSVDFPGYKQWFFQLTYEAFDGGPFLPTALVEVANLPDGPSFRFFAWLFPTTGGRAPRSTIGAGGNGLILSQSLSFRITSQGGDGQGYGWTGVTLLLVPPVSGSGGGGSNNTFICQQGVGLPGTWAEIGGGFVNSNPGVFTAVPGAVELHLTITVALTGGGAPSASTGHVDKFNLDHSQHIRLTDFAIATAGVFDAFYLVDPLFPLILFTLIPDDPYATGQTVQRTGTLTCGGRSFEPVPVVHAMAITTLAAFADPGGTSRRGRSFGQVV